MPAAVNPEPRPETYPKVLFCTWEVPQSVFAGSMQLFRVMQDYPGERLMVMGNAPQADAQRLPCRYETLNLLTYRLACTRFRLWTSGLNAMNTFVEPQLGRSLKLAREFGPDLVVTVMDKLSYYKHAWALARRLRAPLLTITMDDPQVFESAHPWLEGAFVAFLRRMYADATLSLGVSHEMCDYLAASFGARAQVLYFGPPEGIRPRVPEASRMLKSPSCLTLGYAGTMSLGYRDGIRTLLQAMEATGTRLVVYSRDSSFLIDHPLVINRGFLAPEILWPSLQEECDAVLLPYSFDGENARIYRTHFPTKLSEYCWSGMPMLLTGPEYATGMRWGQRHADAALTATTPVLTEFAQVLERLRIDSEMRVSMSRAGAEVARAEFEPAIIRQRFAGLIRQAAGGPADRAMGAAK